MVGRYYGRQATECDVEQAFVDFPSDHLREPTGVLLGAVGADGEAVGCAGLQWSADGEAQLTRVWVDARARRCGAAAALLGRAEQLARARGCRAVWLEGRRDLVEAQQLYRAAGYAQKDALLREPAARGGLPQAPMSRSRLGWHAASRRLAG